VFPVAAGSTLPSTAHIYFCGVNKTLMVNTFATPEDKITGLSFGVVDIMQPLIMAATIRIMEIIDNLLINSSSLLLDIRVYVPTNAIKSKPLSGNVKGTIKIYNYL
jgi:hypothetical protein